MSDSLRDVLRKLAISQRTLARLRELNAPAMMISNQERLVKSRESQLWEIMGSRLEGAGTITPVIGIFNRESLLAQCEALVRQQLGDLFVTPFIEMNLMGLIRDRLGELGFEEAALEETPHDQFDTLASEHLPELYQLYESAWEVYYDLFEQLFTEKWQMMRQVLKM